MQKGRRLSKEDLERIKPGDYVWVHWCKDDDPDRERWNHPVLVTAIETDARGMKSMLDDEGYDWDFDGDCAGRGTATYYEVINEKERNMKIELGLTYRDVITGFTGVAMAKTEWLTGCDRVTLAPRELKDGKPLDMMSFDVTCLELVEDVPKFVPNDQKLEPEPKTEKKQKPGGPRPEPSRAVAPR